MIPVFIHVPRTAGTTLREAILRHYAPGEVMTWDDSTTARGWQAALHARVVMMIPYPANESVQSLGAPKLIMGHLPYLPDGHWQHDPFSYFTFLREPVQRVISDYHWTGLLPAHRFHNHCAGLTLPEALTAKQYINLDNIHVRLYANAMDVPFGELDGGHLASAIEALETFAFVGLTEHFEDGVRELERLYDWKNLPAQLVDKNRIQYDRERDPNLAELVAEVNHWDIALYEHVLRQRAFGHDGAGI
jgi:hypothetical protein